LKGCEVKFLPLASIAALSAVLSACSSSAQGFAPAETTGNPAASVAGSMDSWHQTLAKTRLPSAGCFKATYPSTQWMRVACATPPRLWFPVPAARRKISAQNVGDGHDYTADTTPNLISTAIGAFPRVTGVTSVTSEGCCGSGGVNSYSLQLNSDFFPTVACGSIANCDGWEQFVYSNPSGSGQGTLFIQDWLVPTQGSGLSGCPPDKGWEYVGIGCVQNSPFGVNIPNVAVTDLNKVIETGDAASTGDSIYMSVGATEYGMQNVQNDGITDLSQHWEGAEFNVIGNGGGDVADFAGKTKIDVSIQTDTGLTTAPTCPANTGTTGESNNLNFIRAPKHVGMLQYPSIEFAMSYKTEGTPSCDTRKGK
jgi:hypothetical protein